MDARLVQVPAADPRACICGSATGPFVDTGFTTVDVYAVYICEKCCKAIAGVFGYETPEQVAARNDLMADLEQELDETKDSLAEARAARVVPIDQVIAQLRGKMPVDAA